MHSWHLVSVTCSSAANDIPYTVFGCPVSDPSWMQFFIWLWSCSNGVLQTRCSLLTIDVVKTILQGSPGCLSRECDDKMTAMANDLEAYQLYTICMQGSPRMGLCQCCNDSVTPAHYFYISCCCAGVCTNMLPWFNRDFTTLWQSHFVYTLTQHLYRCFTCNVQALNVDIRPQSVWLAVAWTFWDQKYNVSLASHSSLSLHETTVGDLLLTSQHFQVWANQDNLKKLASHAELRRTTYST